jgi:8-oxo-dGTP diphosphatase
VKAANSNQNLIPAVSVIVRHQGRFLMVERGAGKWKGSFAFPGGKVEPGESQAAAALRELHEETGLLGRDPRHFKDFVIDPDPDAGPDRPVYALAVFMARIDGSTDAVAADDAASAAWLTIDEALEKLMPNSVRECLLDLAAD